MANIEPRRRKDGTISAYRVQWRTGGTRTGDRDGRTLDTEPQAILLKALVDAAGNRMPPDEQLRACGLGFLAAPLPESVPAPAAAVPTFGARCLELIEWKIAAGQINGKTVQTYRSRYELHVKGTELAALPINEVEPWHLLTWQKDRRKKLSSKSVRNLRGEIINPTLEEAMKVGPNGEPPLIRVNPLASVPAPKMERAVHAILDGDDEAVVFLDAMYNGYTPPGEDGKPGTPVKPTAAGLRSRKCAADLAAVDLCTGLRWDEIAPLSVGQVDRKRRQIEVSQTLIWIPKGPDNPGGGYWLLRKHGKSDAAHRWTTYPASLDGILAERCKGKRASDLVFPGPSGNWWSYQSFRYHWNRGARAVADKLGKHIEPHGLRRSALSALADEADLATLKHVAGHKNVATTIDLYVKPTKRGIAAAQAALEPLAASVTTVRT